MNLNDYQKQAAGTSIHRTVVEKTAPFYHYLTFGLVGEAGEVAEKVKKILRDSVGEISPMTKNELAKELGDVLWYLSQLSAEFGFDFETIAQMNLDKLHSRLERKTLNGSGDNR